MLIKYILLLLVTMQLYALNILERTYYVESHTVKLSSFVSNIKDDFNLFEIPKNKYTKKIKSKELLKLLSNNGYSNFIAKHKYIKFIVKSPIDTTRIKSAIAQYYEENYANIKINNIIVEPRGYITSLPQEYIVKIKAKNYLQRSGTLSIKTSKNKKIFFDYDIKATITLHVSRKKIKKDEELSVINIRQKSVLLDKFRAKPIQNIVYGSYQAKHHISIDKVITSRDVLPLHIVRRNSNIQINLYDNDMIISFSAKALQNGKVNDIIKVQKTNGKILKVRVTGRNTAEMR